MNFTMERVIDPALVVEFDADDKEDALRKLLASFVANGDLKDDDVNGAFYALMKREELGSLGIGGGLAFPHSKYPSASRIAVVVGRSSAPVDWYSIDRLPVRIVFCMISPPSRPGNHLRTLQLIASFARWAPLDRLLDAHDFREAFMETALEFDARERRSTSKEAR